MRGFNVHSQTEALLAAWAVVLVDAVRECSIERVNI